VRILGREPALWLSLASTIIKLIAAFWLGLGIEQQSALNAVLAAIVGLWIAAVVKDGLGAAALGIVQALLALAIGFGLHLDPENQALIMTLAGTVVAMFIRTQVTVTQPPV